MYVNHANDQQKKKKGFVNCYFKEKFSANFFDKIMVQPTFQNGPSTQTSCERDTGKETREEEIWVNGKIKGRGYKLRFESKGQISELRQIAPKWEVFDQLQSRSTSMENGEGSGSDRKRFERPRKLKKK